MTVSQAFPSHVPPELVMEFPLTTRTLNYENPFNTLVPELHKGPSIFWSTNAFPGPTGGWVIRRQEDLKSLYEHTAEFVKRGNTGFSALIGEDWDIVPSELDAPKHTAFRRALEPVFSPKRMAELESKVLNRASDLIAKFKDKGEVEFIKAFATPFPCTIVLDLLGLPQDRLDEFLDWEYGLIHKESLEERKQAVMSVRNCLWEEIEKREKNPTDDLISNALNLEADGRKWTRDEVFGHCFNLFIGGLDTVTANLGLHFTHLATHLDDQRELREDPQKIDLAIPELMRAYAAVTTARVCAKDFTLHGVTIKAGDLVAMSTPLGSNDPEVYDAPELVKIDRRPLHLSFGHGIHRCLGAHLARRELKVAMTEMLQQLPEFRLKPGTKVGYYMSNVIHVDKLPLVWS
ncbi:MAG: cytochrome P450 [Spongiibacteraceae bacterium]